jgi:hypothetical protein
MSGTTETTMVTAATVATTATDTAVSSATVNGSGPPPVMPAGSLSPCYLALPEGCDGLCYAIFGAVGR